MYFVFFLGNPHIHTYIHTYIYIYIYIYIYKYFFIQNVLSSLFYLFIFECHNQNKFIIEKYFLRYSPCSLKRESFKS